MIDAPEPQVMQESQVIPKANEPNIIEPKYINLRRPNTPSMELRALKLLQHETRAIEVDFFEQVYQIEMEFQQRHELVYQKRCKIINGDYVPTEPDSRSVGEKDTQLIQQEANVSNEGDVETTTPSGVPHFWLNVFTSSLPDIHLNDRPILEHLTDVRGKNKPFSDLGFTLEFHFSPNDYFENAVLQKEYFYTSSDNKLIHEIPLIWKSIGCEIKWKSGKTPTNRSWFDFVAASKIISDSDEEFMDCMLGIQNDFEMGYFIKEHVIPKAVLYFTGEEKNLFTISNYNSEFWSPTSTGNSSGDDDTSEDGSKSESEDF